MPTESLEIHPFEKRKNLIDTVKYLLETPDIFENRIKEVWENETKGQVGKDFHGTNFNLSVIGTFSDIQFTINDWKNLLPKDSQVAFDEFKKKIMERELAEEEKQSDIMPEEPAYLRENGRNNLTSNPDGIDYEKMSNEKLWKILKVSYDNLNTSRSSNFAIDPDLQERIEKIQLILDKRKRNQS